MESKLRKTKIVCTIGPASENRIEELIKAGMNVARINFSHGSYEEQREKTERIMKIREEMNEPLALLLDMKGPEIRTGKLKDLNVKVVLNEGADFLLTNEEILGDETQTSISYKDLYKDITVGSKILLDDGIIELKVSEIIGKDIKCKVMNTGKLGSRKGVNVPGVALGLPALAEKDIQDLKDGARVGFDYVAASFVRDKEDVLAVREVLNANGGEDIKIISKIENQQGIDNIQEILDYSDGVMVARGDLSVEVPFEYVPIEQKRMIRLSNLGMKPVITATQMLESMTENPLPTRAEVSDVANAVFDQTSAIMLSGECAMGKYPIKCVETMDKIAKTTEPTIHYWTRFEKSSKNLHNVEVNIADSTIYTAKDLEADSIICYTHTGDSARNLAGLGAKSPIFAITDSKKVFNQLALVWNVTPIMVENEKNIDEVIEKGINMLIEKNYITKGHTAVLSGGKEVVRAAKESKMIASILKF